MGWEEKDYSKWAQERLKVLLVETECPAFSAGDLKITEVTKAEGDATILFLRGKKRIGFEMNLKAKWKAKCNGKSVSGHVEIPSFDSDDWPDEIEIDITAEKTDNDHRAAREYMKSVKSSVMKQLEVFYNELKKKMKYSPVEAKLASY